MLSSVLSSEQAIQTNIQIMRVFTKFRNMISETESLRLDVEKITTRLDNQEKNIELVFQYRRIG
jgi:regulator of replication initiation timing